MAFIANMIAAGATKIARFTNIVLIAVPKPGRAASKERNAPPPLATIKAIAATRNGVVSCSVIVVNAIMTPKITMARGTQLPRFPPVVAAAPVTIAIMTPAMNAHLPIVSVFKLHHSALMIPFVLNIYFCKIADIMIDNE